MCVYLSSRPLLFSDKLLKDHISLTDPLPNPPGERILPRSSTSPPSKHSPNQHSSRFEHALERMFLRPKPWSRNPCCHCKTYSHFNTVLRNAGRFKLGWRSPHALIRLYFWREIVRSNDRMFLSLDNLACYIAVENCSRLIAFGTLTPHHVALVVMFRSVHYSSLHLCI